MPLTYIEIGYAKKIPQGIKLSGIYKGRRVEIICSSDECPLWMVKLALDNYFRNKDTEYYTDGWIIIIRPTNDIYQYQVAVIRA